MDALVYEGILTKEQAEIFSGSHVCQIVDEESMWNRLRSYLKMGKSQFVMCFKIVSVETKKNDGHNPEQVFPPSDLDAWALENGYVKQEEKP